MTRKKEIKKLKLLLIKNSWVAVLYHLNIAQDFMSSDDILSLSKNIQKSFDDHPKLSNLHIEYYNVRYSSTIEINRVVSDIHDIISQSIAVEISKRF